MPTNSLYEADAESQILSIGQMSTFRMYAFMRSFRKLFPESARCCSQLLQWMVTQSDCFRHSVRITVKDDDQCFGNVEWVLVDAERDLRELLVLCGVRVSFLALPGYVTEEGEFIPSMGHCTVWLSVEEETMPKCARELTLTDENLVEIARCRVK